VTSAVPALQITEPVFAAHSTRAFQLSTQVDFPEQKLAQFAGAQPAVSAFWQ
jgi:hypothetical protein